MPTQPPILDYQGPKGDSRPDIFTDGRTDLYLRLPGGELPNRCIICNVRTSARQTAANLKYVDPKIRRSYRGGIMFYWVYILVMIVRGIHERAASRFVRVSYSVCPHHRSNRGLKIVLRLALLAACIVAMIMTQLLSLSDAVAFVSCIAIVVNLMYPWPERQLRIDRMTATHAVIVGPSEEFLQSLRRPRGL